MSTSRSVHTWSVNPATIAGVCDRHCLAEPLPLVSLGRDNGRRKLVCGKQCHTVASSEVGYTDALYLCFTLGIYPQVEGHDPRTRVDRGCYTR
jgi:hypothetical protein